MHSILQAILLFAITTAAHADFSNDGVPATPDILTRIIVGAERSGEPLQSKATKGESDVYYLRSAKYIGECIAPFGTVHIAQLLFIRSGVRGQQTPPRGHAFLVFYDSDFRVRGYWREPGGPYRVDGSKLLEGDRELFDYANLPKNIDEVHGTWPHPPIWKRERQQAGADHPATKPVDQPPVKDQPSTPTPKDGPR